MYRETGDNIRTIESMPGKACLRNGRGVHSEAGKEDHAQSSTSEVAPLQFNSSATGDRFCQFKFHFQSLITENVCGNGLTHPSKPKR